MQGILAAFIAQLHRPQLGFFYQPSKLRTTHRSHLRRIMQPSFEHSPNHVHEHLPARTRIRKGGALRDKIACTTDKSRPLSKAFSVRNQDNA